MRSMNTISAIVGLDTKATMDLDKTIKEFTLKHEANRKIFTETCTVKIADDIQLSVSLTFGKLTIIPASELY